MPPRDKPRHRSGYRREETEQVEATCLTIGLALGSLMNQMCIVGGLVPSLIIDRDPQPDDKSDEAHVGTNDLDVGLAVALPSRYWISSNTPRSVGGCAQRVSNPTSTKMGTPHPNAGAWGSSM
jgi:hypothetical protein